MRNFIIDLFAAMLLCSCLGPQVNKIIVNPYKTSPLSAVYRTIKINTHPVTVRVKGLYGEPDIVHTYPAGYGREFEIHGMFPQAENIIIVQDGEKEIQKKVFIPALKFKKKKFPSHFNVRKNENEEKNQPFAHNPAIYFIGFPQDEFNVGISANGYVRYASTLKYFLKIIDEDQSIRMYSYNQGVYTLAGRKIVDFAHTTHHDAIKKGDHYIFLGVAPWSLEDRITEVDLHSRIIKDFNAGDLIKEIVMQNGDMQEKEILNKIIFDKENKYALETNEPKGFDWLHINSIVYDADTDILYASSRHHGVLAIDYSKLKLLWWMADDSLATQKGSLTPYVTGIPYQMYFKDLKSLQPYRVKGDAVNDGPKNQHALFLLENGNLGMFDNQGDEEQNPNGSRYVEYKISGQHGHYTAEKVYEYRNQDLYSRITSDVDYTGENYENILLFYGTIYTLIEVNKNSKKELFKMDLNLDKKSFSFAYRADKMPFYYDEGRVYSQDASLKAK